MDASSDERQKLINNLHTLADIALVGDYMRDRVPPRVMALKLQPVDAVYPPLPGKAALDTIKVAERDQQRRVYNTEVMTADAEYEHQQLKAQALMNLWMDYILGPNMQYMLDNYRRKHPRRAPPTRGADGEEILGEVLKYAYDGIGMMKELLTWLDRGATQRDKDRHVAVINAMRRTALPDNCTADDFLDRLQTMENGHNRFLDKSERVTKKAMSRFILAIMPKSF